MGRGFPARSALRDGRSATPLPTPALLPRGSSRGAADGETEGGTCGRPRHGSAARPPRAFRAAALPSRRPPGGVRFGETAPSHRPPLDPPPPPIPRPTAAHVLKIDAPTSSAPSRRAAREAAGARPVGPPHRQPRPGLSCPCPLMLALPDRPQTSCADDARRSRKENVMGMREERGGGRSAADGRAGCTSGSCECVGRV